MIIITTHLSDGWRNSAVRRRFSWLQSLLITYGNNYLWGLQPLERQPHAATKEWIAESWKTKKNKTCQRGTVEAPNRLRYLLLFLVWHHQPREYLSDKAKALHGLVCYKLITRGQQPNATSALQIARLADTAIVRKCSESSFRQVSKCKERFLRCTSESRRAGPWAGAAISVKELEVKQRPFYFPLKQGRFRTNVKLDTRWERQSRSQRRITFLLGSVGECSKVQYTLITRSIQSS